jgi:hypothetical protein
MDMKNLLMELTDKAQPSVSSAALVDHWCKRINWEKFIESERRSYYD